MTRRLAFAVTCRTSVISRKSGCETRVCLVEVKSYLTSFAVFHKTICLPSYLKL